MASTPPDYFGLMGGRENMIDPSRAISEGIMNQLRPQLAQVEIGRERRLQSAADREVQRQASFAEELEAVSQLPAAEQAAAYARLSTRYPEFATPVRQGWQMLDEDRRSRDFSALGQVYSAGLNDRWDLVEQLLRTRMDAEVTGGLPPDPTDAAILEMVRSGDADQRRRALGMVGLSLATIEPERFAPNFNALRDASDEPEFVEYARQLGLEPGTDAYRQALQDYVLRGAGPTATELNLQEEEVRQGNRVELEDRRHRNRGREIDQRERNTRGRPAREQRPTSGTVIGRIMDKMARGEALTPGEQRVWNDYQSRGQRGRSTGRGRGGSAVPDGAIARNPQTGQRMQMRGGRWVPIQ